MGCRTSPDPKRFFSHHSSPVACEGTHIRMQPLSADRGILRHPLVNILDGYFETFLSCSLSKLKTSEIMATSHYVGLAFPGAQIWYFKLLLCRDTWFYFCCVALSFQYVFQSSHKVSHVVSHPASVSRAFLDHVPQRFKRLTFIIASCESLRVPLRKYKSVEQGSIPDLQASDVLSGWNSGTASTIHSLILIPLENGLNLYPSTVLQRLSETASLQSCFDCFAAAVPNFRNSLMIRCYLILMLSLKTSVINSSFLLSVSEKVSVTRIIRRQGVYCLS